MKKIRKFPICMLLLSIIFGINTFVFSQDTVTVQQVSDNGTSSQSTSITITETPNNWQSDWNNNVDNNVDNNSQWTEKKTKECPKWCCGIKLNTNFPIIWDCIWDKESENPTNAFPTMIWAITKIVMSLVLVVCFIMIIVAGIMRAWDNPKWWKELIKKVAVTILVLWFSGVILRLINPNFFS